MGKALELTTEAYPHYPDADSFDFRKSWAGIKQACSGHKMLIAMTCVLTLALTMLYVVVWPPIFIATVELVGESDKDISREEFYQSWNVFRKEQLTDEVQMFTAAPVLGEVIHRLGLTYDEVYHPFLSHLGYLWTESLPGRTYRTIKNWIFPKRKGPYDPTQEQIDFARTLHDFKSGVQLDSVMETNLGKVSVKGPSPRVAEIANTIVAVYLEQRRTRHVQEAEASYQALNGELAKTQNEIVDVEDRMRKYYSDNHLLLTFEQDKLDIGQSQALKGAINDLQTTIAGEEQAIVQVTKDLAKEEKTVVASSVTLANPVRDGLLEKMSVLQISRNQALLHFRPDAPEVMELDRQIGIITGQLSHEPEKTMRQQTLVLSSNYEALRARKAQLEADLAAQRASLAVRMEAYAGYQPMLDTIPEKMRIVHDLDREHQALEKKYAAIQDKLMIAAVSRATAQSAPPSIQIVEDAAAPSDVSWPKTKLLLLLAAALGLVAGVLLSLLMDLFFGRVHRYRLAGMQGELPVYALVKRDRLFAAELFSLPAADEERADRRLLKHGD